MPRMPRWPDTTVLRSYPPAWQNRATKQKSKMVYWWSNVASSPGCATGPYFSLAELNSAIAELLEVLNAAPFQKRSGSRKELFEALERPAMQPLPACVYEYAEWKKVRCG